MQGLLALMLLHDARRDARVDDAGELVAAAVLTRYRPGTAVISMVLVASRLERRGLGTRLMTHLVDHAGPGPVYLYATENGRPLYEKVGFVLRRLMPAAASARSRRVSSAAIRSAPS